MKRFIDLRNHEEDIGGKFAWFDTVVDRFESFMGEHVFVDFDDFKEVFTGYCLDQKLSAKEAQNLFKRYTDLMPDWTGVNGK